MIPPHLKFAFKSVRKHSAPSLINFFGFVFGITGAVLLMAILQHDLSYDSYHDNDQGLYRMSIKLNLPSGERHFASTSVVSATNLVEAIPEITGTIRHRVMPATLQLGEDVFANEPFTFVDSAFFQAFKVELIQGSLPAAREHILLSSRTAERLFGNESPVGLVIQTEAAYGRRDLMVSGVFQSYPSNVSFQPSFITSFEHVESLHNQSHGGLMPGLSTFLLTNSSVDKALLNQKLSTYYEANLPDNLFDVLKHQVEPYREIHFLRGLEFDLGQKLDKQTIWVLGVLAAFIIGSTLINYFNMQTALVVQRIKELSIKKALGQSEGSRFIQSVFESLVLLFPAFAMAGLGIYQVVKLMEEYTGLDLAQGWLSDQLLPFFILALFIAFWLLTTMVSVVLQRATQRKAVISRSKPSFGLLRKSLIGVQFALAGFFIFSALVISDQLNYMNSRDLGYGEEGLINIQLSNVSGFQEAEGIKQTVASVPGVKIASISQSPVFGTQGKSNFTIHQDTGSVNMLLNYNYVDEDFMNTNELVLLAGEALPANRRLLMINQQAVKTLGYTSFEDALGRKMTFSSRDTTLDYTIGGIVSDFHYATMHQSIEPIVLLKNELGGYYNLTVKTESIQFEPIVSGIEMKWQERFPGQQLNYRIMTDVLARAYEDDTQKATFYQWATLLLVVISALGIFGLTYYYTDQKRKEIGIRKAIGAQLSNILMQIGRPVALICLVAAVLAIPMGFLISSEWLGGYEYRVELGLVQVVWTLLIMFGLSTIALFYPGLRASRINPVDALRED